MSEIDELRAEIEELRGQIPVIDEEQMRWLHEVDPLRYRVGAIERRLNAIVAVLKEAGFRV